MSCNKNTHVIQIKHLLTSEKNIFEALNFNKTSWLAEKVQKINFFVKSLISAHVNPYSYSLTQFNISRR